MTDFEAYPARRVGSWLFWCAIVLGLAVRIAVLTQTTGLGTTILDEQHYAAIARNLVAGNGFAAVPGQRTSIRPPLYPALLAVIWSSTGSEGLQAVRVCQIVMAAITAVLLYLLGARVYSTTAGRWAAAVFWLYPTLIFFNFLILTETLFTLLLVGFVLLAVMLVQQPRAWVAVACGLCLGLGALTRSVLWPLPLVLCPLLALLIRERPARRAALPLLVFAGYALAVGPWAVRNTRLQGVFTVVDTMGGMNLRMGNYEYTPDDRMWDAVSLGGDRSWIKGLTKVDGEEMTEGRKEKWAQRKAIEYMRANPGVTLRRAIIKFGDLWGLEREFIAGVRVGFFSPPSWFQLPAAILIVVAYVLVVVAGVGGAWLSPPRDWRVHVLLLLPVALIVGVHTIVFGHSRYHLPLIPLLAVYAGGVLTSTFPRLQPVPRISFVGSLATVGILLAIWIHQVAIVDAARIADLLQHLG